MGHFLGFPPYPFSLSLGGPTNLLFPCFWLWSIANLLLDLYPFNLLIAVCLLRTFYLRSYRLITLILLRPHERQEYLSLRLSVSPKIIHRRD